MIYTEHYEIRLAKTFDIVFEDKNEHDEEVILQEAVLLNLWLHKDENQILDSGLMDQHVLVLKIKNEDDSEVFEKIFKIRNQNNGSVKLSSIDPQNLNEMVSDEYQKRIRSKIQFQVILSQQGKELESENHLKLKQMGPFVNQIQYTKQKN